MSSIFMTDEVANARLDKHVNDKILSYLENNILPNYKYTKESLFKMINSEETLEEYIRDTELEFDLPRKNLNEVSDSNLNVYIMKLDLLWGYRNSQY